MTPVRYHVTDANELERIRPLWEKMRAFHVACSPQFSDSLAKVTFEERREALCRKSEGGLLRLEIVQAEDGDRGYCISTISGTKAGEIDSIYVEEAYRGRGIGTALMEHAIEWLEAHRADPITLAVAVGNVEVMAFYRRFGFFPRQIILERRIDEEQRML